jgi:hypothetical protein
VSLSVFAMSGDERLGLQYLSGPLEIRSVMRSLRCEDSSVLMPCTPIPHHQLLPLILIRTTFVKETNGMCSDALPAQLQLRAICCRCCVSCSSIISGYCDLSVSDRSMLWPSTAFPISCWTRRVMWLVVCPCCIWNSMRSLLLLQS